MSREIKIQAEYIDTGFGFPVHLLNVPMMKVRGIWTPKVDYVELTARVLQTLALKASPLTGNQLKFIRLHFEMNLADFAKRFYVTHPAVLKWESKGDSATGMNWSTEKDIRLFISTQVSEKEVFFAAYQQLEKKPSLRNTETEVDLSQAKEAVLV